MCVFWFCSLSPGPTLLSASVNTCTRLSFIMSVGGAACERTNNSCYLPPLFEGSVVELHLQRWILRMYHESSFWIKNLAVLPWILLFQASMKFEGLPISPTATYLVVHKCGNKVSRIWKWLSILESSDAAGGKEGGHIKDEVSHRDKYFEYSKNRNI